MAPEPPNPYAPTDALTHDAPKDPERPPRRPSRLLAALTSFLAYPLVGAGLYISGRKRRFAFWVTTGVVIWTILVVAIRAPVPRLSAIAIALMTAALLIAVIDTAVARPADGGQVGGRAWLIALGIVLAGKGAGLATKQWLVEAFQMPSGSMEPTLLVGDHMFIKKGRADIARGDAIVFKFPSDPSVDYIKRVVAVGGDTVEVRGSELLVNGVALDHQPIDEPCSYRDESSRLAEAEDPCELVRETNDGRSYTVMFVPSRPTVDHPRTIVPPNNVFVLGDNRDNSYDSRRWGTVDVDLIKGKATVIWWSSGESGIRWSRIGRGIE